MPKWRHRYVNALMQRMGRITLPIGPSNDERIRLHAIFQPLTLRQDPLAAEDLAREERRPLLGEEEPRQQAGPEEANRAEDGPLTVPTAHDALRHSRFGRMVVLGGPGTGKTTVLKELVVAACRQALRSDSAPLPLFISLPDFARGEVTVREYLPEQMVRLGLPPELGAELWDTVTTGQALVCLDSLDEVAPDRRPQIISWISQEAPRCGGQWVIGSRFTSYKGGELGAETFSEWELAPLDEPLRLELARRLLPIVRGALHTPPLLPEEDAAGLIAALAAHPQARAWGENPLLLSLAAVAYVRNAGLPSSRAALYGEVLTAVFRTREPDSERRLELMRALSRVALLLFLSKGRTFTRQELEDAILVLDAPATDLASRAIASGVLDVVAHDIFAFRHQTLQEYLAASALAFDLTGSDTRANSAWELMWSKRTYSRWTEVLRLVVGILVREHGAEGARQARRWLTALAEQTESPEGDPGHLGLTLAIRSAAEVAEAPARGNGEDRIEVTALLVRHWAALSIVAYRTYGEARSVRQMADEIRYLGPQPIAEGMDETLATLATGASHRRQRALESIQLVADFVPTAPLVAHWQALQSMSRDDSWSWETASTLRSIAMAGRRAPTDLLLAAAEVNPKGAYRALALAASLGNEAAAAACRRLADDPDAFIRKAIMAGIGVSPSRELIDVALAGLRDADINVRRTSAHLWQYVGRKLRRVPEATKPLLEALQDADGQVRGEAAYALGLLQAKEAAGALTPALRDPDAWVRQQAVKALGELRAPVTFASLVERLADESLEMRALMVVSLAKIDPAAAVPHVVGFIEANGDTVYMGLVALSSLRKLVPIDTMVKLASLPFPRVRETAARLLALHGDAAPREPLVASLTDEYSGVRSSATATLGLLGDRVMIPVLRPLLADSDWSVRTEAAAALARLGEPGGDLSVEDLVDEMRACDDETVAVALAIAGELKEEAPLDLLGEGLRAPSVRVRQAAVEALGTVGSPEAGSLLTSALGDVDPSLRSAAVLAFENIPPELLPISELVRLLRTDAEAGVRARAADELKRTGAALPSADLIAALADSDVHVRVVVVNALSLLGAGAPLASLVAALDDPSFVVRTAAAQAVSAFGDRIPKDKLLTALQRSPAGYYHQASFTAALGALRDQIPIDVLLAAERDPDCSWRLAAIAALGYYGEEAPIERLFELLAGPPREPSHEELAQSQAACAALLQLGTLIPAERMLALLASGGVHSSDYGERALIALGADAPVDRILPLLANRDPGVRFRVLRCLCGLGVHTPSDVFVTALDDPSEHIRELAATEIRERSFTPALHQLEVAKRRAGTDSFAVRVALEHALIAVGGDADSAVLLQAMQEGDNDYGIPRKAVEALKAMGSRAPGEELLPYLGMREVGAARLAAEVLHATHPELLRSALPEITAIVRQRQAGIIVGSRMRTAMAHAIGNMPRVPPALLAVLADLLDWPFAPVRQAAARALGQIRRDIPDNTIRKLLSMRSGPDQAAVDSALEQILSLETGIEDD